MTFVLGHTGHWLVNVLYAAPVVAVTAYIAWGEVKRRRRGRTEEHSDS